MRSRLVLLFATLGALLHPAGQALAAHYVVDPQGGGDFTTIQTALFQQWFEWRDSLLIRAGAYPETVSLNIPSPYYLGPVDGVGRIEIDSLFVPSHASVWPLLDRFTFPTRVELGWSFGSNGQFRNCILRRGIFFGGLLPPHFVDCDFFGRVDLPNIENPGHATFQSSRFHAAPLTLGASNGTISIFDCTFEGPADTLVHVTRVTGVDFVIFEGCRFEGANYGIVVDWGYGTGFGVGRCTFRDIGRAGVWYERVESVESGNSISWLFGGGVTDSRFERCGQAIHWRGLLTDSEGAWQGVRAGLARDTVLSCTSTAVELGPLSQSSIVDCVIDGSQGDGVVVRQDHPTTGWCDDGLSLVVSGSSFTNNLGAGLVIRDSTRSSYDNIEDAVAGPDHVVRGSSFVGNTGRGADLSCADLVVEDCLAAANGGDGIAWRSSATTRPVRIESNTAALNRGDGLVATDPTAAGDSLWLLRLNLAVVNTRNGFRVPHTSVGSFAFNDAWGNHLTQYVGAWASLDSNLTVDPRFCDLSAGVVGLGLQQGSPCGPSGVYGLIGARPEECPSTLTVEPPAPGALAFAVRPSIARGAADFVPPSTGAEGIVELFDLAGRVVWRAPLGPASGVVRWRGEGESGRVRAGLYWARYTRGSERATQRLVWLE